MSSNGAAEEAAAAAAAPVAEAPGSDKVHTRQRNTRARTIDNADPINPSE